MVRRSTEVLVFEILTSPLYKFKKVNGLYNPLLETCIIEGTHRGLVNALGVLVVDVVLLVTMLIGLLRHANRSATGIWQVLYQQVMLNLFSYAGY